MIQVCFSFDFRTFFFLTLIGSNDGAFRDELQKRKVKKHSKKLKGQAEAFESISILQNS